MAFVGWAFAIALFHLAIDILKSFLTKKGVFKRYLFFIDQGLHIFFIVSVVYCFLNLVGFSDFPYAHRTIFILFALIACTKPSNIFIKRYMEAQGVIVYKKEENTLMNAGRVIGSLERILSFCLIAFNQFAAVGFIIAAKSILRFRDKDTAKTEYVLIGSLLSFGIAFLLGITYQLII
jgi:hypothetical protein